MRHNDEHQSMLFSIGRVHSCTFRKTIVCSLFAYYIHCNWISKSLSANDLMNVTFSYCDLHTLTHQVDFQFFCNHDNRAAFVVQFSHRATCTTSTTRKNQQRDNHRNCSGMNRVAELIRHFLRRSRVFR